MKIKITLMLIFSALFSCLVVAAQPAHPLTFKGWKRLQVHDSRQLVVKLSNEINSLLVDQNTPEKSSEEEQQIILKGLAKKKLELKSKLENLQYSKQLKFGDYFDVYLSKFSGNKEALNNIAKRLSKASVAYLLEKSLGKDKPKRTKDIKEPNDLTSQN